MGWKKFKKWVSSYDPTTKAGRDKLGVVGKAPVWFGLSVNNIGQGIGYLKDGNVGATAIGDPPLPPDPFDLVLRGQSLNDILLKRSKAGGVDSTFRTGQRGIRQIDTLLGAPTTSTFNASRDNFDTLDPEKLRKLVSSRLAKPKLERQLSTTEDVLSRRTVLG